MKKIQETMEKEGYKSSESIYAPNFKIYKKKNIYITVNYIENSKDLYFE